MTKSFGFGVAALLVGLLAAGCGSAENSDLPLLPLPGASGNPSTAPDSFTFGSTTYVEAANADNASGFDPWVFGRFNAVLSTYVGFSVSANFDSSLGEFLDTIVVRAYPTAGDGSVDESYTLTTADGPPGQTYFFVETLDSSGSTLASCEATGGTFDITSDKGQGGAVVGTFNVTSWNILSGTCPATPTTGAFSLTREINFGNTGTQGDTLAITPNGGPTTNYVEVGSPIYDPIVQAYFLSGFPTSFSIEGIGAGNVVTSSYGESVQIQLVGLPVNFDTAGGVFTVGTDAVISYSNAANVSCVANAGATATVAPYPNEGSKFTVDVVVAGFGASGFCGSPPATPFTANFNVTRDPQH